MYELQSMDEKNMRIMMADYEIFSKMMFDPVYKIDYTPYIPSVIDFVSSFPELDIEQSQLEAIKLSNKYQIFIRYKSEYNYFPLKGVW